jgi:hypothetical protein
MRGREGGRTTQRAPEVTLGPCWVEAVQPSSSTANPLPRLDLATMTLPRFRATKTIARLRFSRTLPSSESRFTFSSGMTLARPHPTITIHNRL